MSATVVLPSIDIDTTRGCIETMRFVDSAMVPILSHPPHDGPDIAVVNGSDWAGGRALTRLMVIYNRPDRNLGVAASWNRGAREMRDAGHDWLVVLSAAVRFGPGGGLDFLRFLDEAGRAVPHPPVIEAAAGLGWHLIAFHRDTLDLVGPFDEVFWPAYYEDNDWSHRYQLATGIDSRAPGFVGPLWPKVEVNATLAEVAHGIKRGGVNVDMAGLEALYVRKWGGKSPNETFTHPYDHPELDWTYTGPCPGTMA